MDTIYLSLITNLQGLVVAEPGGARRQTRQDEKEPTFSTDVDNFGLTIGQENHGPGHKNDDNRANSSC